MVNCGRKLLLRLRINRMNKRQSLIHKCFALNVPEVSNDPARGSDRAFAPIGVRARKLQGLYENFNHSRNWRHSLVSHGQECYTRLFQSGSQHHGKKQHLSRHRKQGPGLVPKRHQDSSGRILLSISSHWLTVILGSYFIIINIFKAHFRHKFNRFHVSLTGALIPTII